jgi:hypothetical protein
MPPRKTPLRQPIKSLEEKKVDMWSFIRWGYYGQTSIGINCVYNSDSYTRRTFFASNYKDIEPNTRLQVVFSGWNELFMKCKKEDYLDMIPHSDLVVCKMDDNVSMNI